MRLHCDVEYYLHKLFCQTKSSLLSLEGKQQVPNSDAIDKFFQNTIQKAYQQLISSCNGLQIKAETPVLKFILLYDEFSNTAILEQSIEEIFLNDTTCYIVTIREFEILLYTHQNKKQIFDEILQMLTSSAKDIRSRKTVSAVLADLSLNENLHLEGEMDYFKKLMEFFDRQL